MWVCVCVCVCVCVWPSWSVCNLIVFIEEGNCFMCMTWQSLLLLSICLCLQSSFVSPFMLSSWCVITCKCVWCTCDCVSCDGAYTHIYVIVSVVYVMACVWLCERCCCTLMCVCLCACSVCVALSLASVCLGFFLYNRFIFILSGCIHMYRVHIHV